MVNSEDPSGPLLFAKDKINLQRKKYIFCLEIITFVCSFMENSIVLKRVEMNS